eukprot:Protomagalhaensia_wolfi_Nauph_80__2077@NODE_232_length_3101_cov_63_265186_g173_i0_p1_GENE_NODE_232_length_3101_cov_63_265186_g173_i0NODE_232_length_3101_cov_63_265186_g173_i0_p1_ORF_typecomplete_len271_score17_43VSNARE_C/PF12352_8/1_6e04VSNARE_C/PF12352_8/5_7e11Sec20/PF03908_13/2_5e02Sec20/PF03908_13/6_8e07ZapB/PF06005_12/0_83ZapB/PF06005_12/9e02_NODE_232_length_3101_cov_63_265186_g173_i011823
MAALEGLYSQVIRVKARLDDAVSLLEFGPASETRASQHPGSAEISTAKQQQLTGLANQLLRYNQDLKDLFHKSKNNLSRQQQASWTRRLEKLGDETKLLVLSVDKALGYIATRREAELDRERLLGDAQARRRERFRGLDKERLVEEESKRLDDSSLVVASMIQQGSSVISNLKSQRVVLKSTVSKMKGAALSMGVSQSLISSVENRLRSDRVLTYGGIIGITLFIYFFYHWWKGYDPFWWFPYRILGHLLLVIFNVWSKPEVGEEFQETV